MFKAATLSRSQSKFSIHAPKHSTSAPAQTQKPIEELRVSSHVPYVGFCSCPSTTARDWYSDHHLEKQGMMSHKGPRTSCGNRPPAAHNMFQRVTRGLSAIQGFQPHEDVYGREGNTQGSKERKNERPTFFDKMSRLFLCRRLFLVLFGCMMSANSVSVAAAMVPEESNTHDTDAVCHVRGATSNPIRPRIPTSHDSKKKRTRVHKHTACAAELGASL